MFKQMSRRSVLASALASSLPMSAISQAMAQERGTVKRPWRIMAVTFRGMTDVEKGFEEYFASRKIPVQIT